MSYSSTILADGPIAFWRFHDAAGSNSAADGGPNNLSGTVVGGDAFSGSTLDPGDPGGSVSLPGGAGGFTLPASALWAVGTGDFAIEIWYLGTDTSTQVAVGWDNNTYLGVIGGKLSWSGCNGSIAVADGKLHHLVVTRLDGAITLYVDGTADGTTGDSTAMTNPPTLGYFPAAGGLGLHGQAADWAVYGYALSASQVAAHHAAGIAAADNTPSSTLASGGNLIASATPAAITLRVPYSGGNAPLSFRWQRAGLDGNFAALVDGSGVSGAAAATLVDASGTLAAGTLYLYRCTVADNVRSFVTYSRPAMLGLAPLTFVAIGDSQSNGVGGGAEPLNGAIYHAAQAVAQFAPQLRSITVRNGAVSGTFTEDWTSRTGPAYATLLAACGGSFANTYVFLRLGANNAQGNRTAASFGADMRAIIANCLADGAAAVLLSYPLYRDPGLYGQDGTSVFADNYLTPLLSYLPVIDGLANGTTVFVADKVSCYQTIQNPQGFMDYDPGTAATTPGTIHPAEAGTAMQGYNEGMGWLRSQGLLGASSTPTNGTGLTPAQAASLAAIPPLAERVAAIQSFLAKLGPLGDAVAALTGPYDDTSVPGTTTILDRNGTPRFSFPSVGRTSVTVLAGGGS